MKIEHISGSTVSNVIQFLFVVYPSGVLPTYVRILRCWALALTLYKAFSKNKKRSGTSFPALISAWPFRKNVSHVIFY